jgi:hypothetical protein
MTRAIGRGLHKSGGSAPGYANTQDGGDTTYTRADQRLLATRAALRNWLRFFGLSKDVGNGVLGQCLTASLINSRSWPRKNTGRRSSSFLPCRGPGLQAGEERGFVRRRGRIAVAVGALDQAHMAVSQSLNDASGCRHVETA